MLIQVAKVPTDPSKKDILNNQKNDVIDPDTLLTEEERKRFIGGTIPVSQIRKGNIILMKGRPCKVVDITCAK